MPLAYSLHLHPFAADEQWGPPPPPSFMMEKISTQSLRGEKQSYEFQTYEFPGFNEDISAAELLLFCAHLKGLLNI